MIKKSNYDPQKVKKAEEDVNILTA